MIGFFCPHRRRLPLRASFCPGGEWDDVAKPGKRDIATAGWVLADRAEVGG
jgi:hypothetical protein